MNDEALDALEGFRTAVRYKGQGAREWEYYNRCVAPDLSFECCGKMFHVDCRYRTSPYRDAHHLDFPRVYRLKMGCFDRISEPIFVAYGTGGNPLGSDRMMFERLDEIGGNRIPLRRFDMFCNNLEVMPAYYKVMMDLSKDPYDCRYGFMRGGSSGMTDVSYT